MDISDSWNWVSIWMAYNWSSLDKQPMTLVEMVVHVCVYIPGSGM